MMLLDVNIDFAAALSAIPGTALATVGAFLVGARFLPLIGAGRGIDGTLQQGGCGLSGNLRNRAGNGILWQGRGKNWNWQRRNLHIDPPGSIAITISRLCHGRNEEIIKYFGVNFRGILSKSVRTSSIESFVKGGVQS
jgi:hypothetical protein